MKERRESVPIATRLKFQLVKKPFDLCSYGIQSDLQLRRPLGAHILVHVCSHRQRPTEERGGNVTAPLRLPSLPTGAYPQLRQINAKLHITLLGL